MTMWKNIALVAIFLGINLSGFGALRHARLSGADADFLETAVVIASIAVPVFVYRIWRDK